MLVVDGIFPVSAPIPTPSSEASGHEASFEKDPHDNALAFVGLIVGSLRLRRCDVSLPLGILDWINVHRPSQGVARQCAAIDVRQVLVLLAAMDLSSST
jgi:hypothetical protein